MSEQTKVVKMTVGAEQKDYFVPADLKEEAMLYAAANVLCANKDINCNAMQTTFDGLLHPEDITEKTIISAMVGAQSRSNDLYVKGITQHSKEWTEIYLRYADKYAGKVIQLAAILKKIRTNSSQKIVVEHINIEAGA
jgi:hypothetical protein